MENRPDMSEITYKPRWSIGRPFLPHMWAHAQTTPASLSISSGCPRERKKKNSFKMKKYDSVWNTPWKLWNSSICSALLLKKKNKKTRMEKPTIIISVRFSQTVSSNLCAWCEKEKETEFGIHHPQGIQTSLNIWPSNRSSSSSSGSSNSVSRSVMSDSLQPHGL